MKRALLTVMVALLLGIFAQPSAAQDAPTVFDEAWLREVATQSDAVNVIASVWLNRTEEGQWRAEGRSGTHNVPANSVIIGSINTGNLPSFEELATDVWFTGPGGEFGSNGSYRAFQLDGQMTAVGAMSIDVMIAAILAESDYGNQIELLDIEWTGGGDVVNRWGSSGPVELLTPEQITALGEENLQPLVVTLPGNTLVWGELLSDHGHMGLVRVDENIYATTCLGGVFVTRRGYRAMQFAERAPGAVLSDTTGCNGEYPVLDESNLVSVLPLAS